MKHLLFTVGTIFIFAAAALGICTDADKMSLENFDRAWGKAGVTGDKAALMTIYADDYVGLPEMLGKAATITQTMQDFERAKADPNGADKVTHDHYFISCTPTSATITHRNTVWTPQGTGGKPEAFYTRSVHTLEKRNGKWQVVSNASGGIDEYAVLWYLEQDWNDAVLKKNKAWFDANFAPDFTSISSTSAKLMNKAEDIADALDPAVTMEQVETTGVNIRIDGNYAVITGVFRTKGKAATGAFDRRIRYTDTWIRRDGRWYAWSSQGTVIPPSEIALNQ